MGALSPTMSIAGAGLLPNPPADVGIALTENTDLANTVAEYTQLSTVSTFMDAVALGNTALTATDISSATFEDLVTIGNVTFPAINNILPSGVDPADIYVNNTAANIDYANAYFLSDAITYNSSTILGDGDLTKFCQAFQQALGYITQANQVINSMNNANVLAQSYDTALGGMDTVSTGGLNQVSNNLQLFASDLSLLGKLIDLTNLEDLGLPGELLAQVGRVSGGEIPAVTDFLLAENIPENQIRNLSRGENTLTSAQEKSAYRAMTAITGETLEQVMLILRVRVSNISNMAELLDPKKLFPTSYQTLVCPTLDRLDTIYLASGAVNENLRATIENLSVSAYSGPNNTNSLDTLSIIIPSDQALANKALARSLSQVKNIISTTLPKLSAAASTVSTVDSPLIANLTTPVPESVVSFYKSALGPGTGPNGTLVIADILGSVAGAYIDANLQVVINSLNEMNNNSVTTNLVVSYDRIESLFNSAYGPATGPVTIPAGPGAGSYTDWNDALQSGLISFANDEINNIAATDVANYEAANSAYSNVVTTLTTQRSSQVEAYIDYGNLQANSKSASMNFTTSLHTYGQDTKPEGASEYIQAIANTSSLSGQCVVAALKEGLNIKNLQDSGIQLDTQLDDRSL